MNRSYTIKDIYKEEPVYFLKLLDDRIIEIKRFSRKTLYTSLPDQKDQIREYFRDRMSGRIKTIQEVIGLVNFLSAIIGE